MKNYKIKKTLALLALLLQATNNLIMILYKNVPFLSESKKQETVEEEYLLTPRSADKLTSVDHTQKRNTKEREFINDDYYKIYYTIGSTRRV